MKIIPKTIKEWVHFLLRMMAITIVIMAGLHYLTKMPGESYAGPFNPLSDREASVLPKLKAHVNMLAGTIGERNIWNYSKLASAVSYIQEVFQGFGYDVADEEYMVDDISVANIVVEITGESAPDEIIVIGAHYDTVSGSPGADDNASAVAGVLEISRLLKDSRPKRTIRFVTFVNEEPPFFRTDRMGSRVNSSRSKNRGDNIKAMISLEMIGYYSDEPGSQQYPFPFSYFFPKTGNFVGFVGNIRSRNLVEKCISSFRSSTDFPSEGISAPGWITGMGWSDQWSFWQEGFQAIMITDTAFFRNRNYHMKSDTPDTLSYDRMSRVVVGVSEVVSFIANDF